MNILSIAGKLTPTGRSPITLDAYRCVHAHDKLSDCNLCVRTCPVDAIRLDANVLLDNKVCAACGLCLHICPVGAYTGNDGAADLFNLVARLPEPPVIELACLFHPSPEQGAIENASVIRTRTCLATLGPSRYLQLVTQVQKIIVRIDTCAECPIGRAQSEIVRSMNTARNILAACGELDRIDVIVEKPGADTKMRSVYDTKNPPVSRRDLFRFFAIEGSRIANRVLASDNEPSVGQVPPPERRRLINTLKQFAPAESARWQNSTVTALGMRWLEADEKCTACGVCTRSCPTGAMQFIEIEDNRYRLALAISECTDCGVCIDMCEPSALRHGDMPTLAELVSPEPRVLREGGLKKCNRCNTHFDERIEGSLCPICRYRLNHPFGSRLPQVAKLRGK